MKVPGHQFVDDFKRIEFLVAASKEAVGEDIDQQEQTEIARALQLDLPEMVGPQIPVLYVEMDGTGVPMVKKETEDRRGKTEGQSAHTREAKLGCRVHANHLGRRRLCHPRS